MAQTRCPARGAAVQFERLHAVILLALGVLLLLVQAFLMLQGFDRRATQPRPTDQSEQVESRRDYQALHSVEYIPGIAGAGLVVLGTTILVRRQKEMLKVLEAMDRFSKQHPGNESGGQPRRATPR